MSQVTLTAEYRSELGSNAVKWLRRAGKLPAVLYGKDVPGKSISLTIDAHEFDRLLALNPLNSLIELQLDKSVIVIIKEIQKHKVKRIPLHVDFMMVNPDLPQEFKLHVSLIGTPIGVKDGGVLEQVSLAVEVSCLPGNLPAAIEVDVTELARDAHIAAKDLVMPPGVTLLADPLQVICICKAVVDKESSQEDLAEPELVRERKPED
ncbi:MAG: 50S ribosomal protein L25 [Symbiobacteriaceae bacterium]|nr:50S ribosomal protein L25 [Symbiobacteriaceae bacterium]